MCESRRKRGPPTSSNRPNVVSVTVFQLSVLLLLAFAARAQESSSFSVIPSVGEFAKFGTFSPDGKLWAGGSSTDHTHLWDVRTAKLIKLYQSNIGSSYTDGVVFFTEDGRRFSDGKFIRDAETGKAVRSFLISTDADGTNVCRHSHFFRYGKSGKIPIMDSENGTVIFTATGP